MLISSSCRLSCRLSCSSGSMPQYMRLTIPVGRATLLGAQVSSLIYAHPGIYQLLMRLIYAGGYSARYQAISELIPDGADVFEACAGDAYLFEHYLKARGIQYRAGELNAGFVAHARARG